MPMVISNHQRIYFRFEGERGAFLMLHHGLFGSHQDWYRAGYVEELAREFRLVIPDARGHGRSDRPTELSDYHPERFAGDLVEIINGLGIRNLHFLGYGMGALIGLEMLRRFPERVRIAVLGGESALMLPATHEYWHGLAQQLERGTLAELTAGLRAQHRLVRWEAADPPEEDRPPALALLQAIEQWPVHGEERISVTSPVTLFSGADDTAAERVERTRGLVNRARLVMFPGFNHAQLFEERTQVSQELVRLLKSGRKEDGDGHHRRHAGEGGAAGHHVPRGDERRTSRPDNRPSGQQDDRRRWDRRNGSRDDAQGGQDQGAQAASRPQGEIPVRANPGPGAAPAAMEANQRLKGDAGTTEGTPDAAAVLAPPPGDSQHGQGADDPSSSGPRNDREESPG